MPLIKGDSKQAKQHNIKVLMSEVGKSPHVQSKKQAIAIMYAKAREK